MKIPEIGPLFPIPVFHYHISMSNSIRYVKCFDPVSKKPYYYNSITHEAQWSLPQGISETREDFLFPKDDPSVCTYVGTKITHFRISLLVLLNSIQRKMTKRYLLLKMILFMCYGHIKTDGVQDAPVLMNLDSFLFAVQNQFFLHWITLLPLPFCVRVVNLFVTSFEIQMDRNLPFVTQRGNFCFFLPM